MKWKEYLMHLWFWIRSIPRRNIEEHLWVATNDNVNQPDCWVCNAKGLEDGQGRMWRID